MGSKYVDITSIMQVVGCVYNNPKLLDITDKYSITEDDFADDFHKIAFGAICPPQKKCPEGHFLLFCSNQRD